MIEHCYTGRFEKAPPLNYFIVCKEGGSMYSGLLEVEDTPRFRTVDEAVSFIQQYLKKCPKAHLTLLQVSGNFWQNPTPATFTDMKVIK